MQAWELLGNRVLDRIQDSPLVSIAAISGYAFGGGLTLAAACDFRVASEDSLFGNRRSISVGCRDGAALRASPG